MRVAIAVLEGCIAMPSVSSMEILLKVNSLRAELEQCDGVDPLFDVQLVAVGQNPVKSAFGLDVRCHAAIDEVDHADLVIVPALDGDVVEQLETARPLVAWVRRQHDRGADVASICTGAFVLAEAGLLDGKAATTHWIAHDLFRSRYPTVELQPQHIIVDIGRVCTSGGATSFLNLLIYLVEKFCGTELAIAAAKMFLIDPNKGPQYSYAMFTAQKNHDDQEVLKAQQLIEAAVDKPLSVSELAQQVATSKRNFIRRFKLATGNTPIEYIQRVKVEAAKKALETSNETISEIVQGVGYEDVPSFRKLFARVTGMTPFDYRRRYSLRHANVLAPG